MLNQLKFDFYKAIKSKSVIIAFIASFAFELFVFIRGLFDGYCNSVIANWLSYNNILLGMLIFSIIFCSHDFATGYLKNIYSNTSKFKYVLSKTIFLLAYSILFLVITFLMYYFWSLFSGDGRLIHTKEMYESGLTEFYNTYDISKLIGTIFLQILGSVAVGLVINLLCVLFNRIIVGIVTVVWKSSSFSIYGIIDELLLKYFTIEIEDFTVGNYTLSFFLGSKINFINIRSLPPYDYTTGLIVASIVLVVAFLLSWLAMCKKNF